jgi:hypothetical protein
MAAVLGDGDPDRWRARLIGAFLFGTTSVAALGSAWLLPRRPRTGRTLGIFAAAGGIFLGWVITQTADTLPGALIGVAIVGGGAVVAWQLSRRSRPKAS